MSKIVKIANEDDLLSLKNKSEIILNALKQKTDIKRYGIRIDKNNPDPYKRIEYTYDAVGMTPAHMDFDNDVFDYGDWKDIWFVKENKPVIIEDGVIKYELDPNNYNLTNMGADLPDLNTSKGILGSSLMSKFPLVWVSYRSDEQYEYITVCEHKYDDTYHAYAYMNDNGEIKNEMFLGVYESSRSLTYDGITYLESYAGGNIGEFQNNILDTIELSKRHGSGWGIVNWHQFQLVNALLLIMGKCEEMQETFGFGNRTNSSDPDNNYDLLQAGQLYDKGQFYGTTEISMALKVFHLENWWGNQWESLSGIVMLNKEYLISLNQPSTVDETHMIHTGIIIDPNSTYKNTVSSIKSMGITEFGRLPVELGGSISTYSCDSVVYNESDEYRYCKHGGIFHEVQSRYTGPLSVAFNHIVSDKWYLYGSRLSYIKTE